jgi:hypothetical protein
LWKNDVFNSRWIANNLFPLNGFKIAVNIGSVEFFLAEKRWIPLSAPYCVARKQIRGRGMGNSNSICNFSLTL